MKQLVCTALRTKVHLLKARSSWVSAHPAGTDGPDPVAPCPRRRFCRQKAGLETRSALFSPRSATEPDVAFSPAFGGSSGSEPGIERVNYSAGGPRSEPAAAAAASLCSRMRRSEVAPISFLLFDPKSLVMAFFGDCFCFCVLIFIGYAFFSLLVIHFFIGGKAICI